MVLHAKFVRVAFSQMPKRQDAYNAKVEVSRLREVRIVSYANKGTTWLMRPLAHLVRKEAFRRRQAQTRAPFVRGI